jgi:hypothetical protein
MKSIFCRGTCTSLTFQVYNFDHLQTCRVASLRWQVGSKDNLWNQYFVGVLDWFHKLSLDPKCHLREATLQVCKWSNYMSEKVRLIEVYYKILISWAFLYFNYNLQWWFLLEYWFLSFCNSSALFSMGLSYFWHDSRSNIWPFINMQSCFP